MSKTAREELADVYAKKAKAGLVDVKFDLNRSALVATGLSYDEQVEAVCAEALRCEHGEKTPLDFGDRHWREPVQL